VLFLLTLDPSDVAYWFICLPSLREVAGVASASRQSRICTAPVTFFSVVIAARYLGRFRRADGRLVDLYADCTRQTHAADLSPDN
jgi:hypothetical protein